jgi:hypothetical protein
VISVSIAAALLPIGKGTKKIILRPFTRKRVPHCGLNITPTAVLFPISGIWQLATFGWGFPVANGMQLDENPPTFEFVPVAVSVTAEWSAKCPVQPAPDVQLIPAGLLVTVPVPRPTEYTASVGNWPTPGDVTVRSEIPAIAVPSGVVAIAVIVVPPVTVPVVANPAEFIVATLTSLELHDT